MLIRLLRGDLRRNTVTALVLLLLMAVATSLVAAGAGTVATVAGSLDRLFERARVPHAMQMHAGDADADVIHEWADKHPDITETQVLPTYPLPVAHLTIAGKPQSDSAIQPSATAQSPQFDVLLGMDNELLATEPGTVHMPLFYHGEVKPGDEITLKIGDETRAFTVAGFLRDAQMNPAMVTSKRVLFAEEDIEWMAATLEPEYLIEFRVADGASPQAVLTDYQSAGLPMAGPAIDGGSIKLLAGLSSTLIVGIMALIALAVALLGMLTVRLAVKAAVAGDLPQIGVLKAIGLSERSIRWTFLTKYVAIACLGALLGLLVTPLLHTPLTQTATLEMGEPDSQATVVLTWVVAAALVALGASIYCWFLLRPIRKVTPLTAMKANTTSKRPWLWNWQLIKTKLPVAGWLGIRNASARGQVGLIALFALITLATLLPAQFASTFRHPELMSYLGIGSGTNAVVHTIEPATAERLSSELPADTEVAKVAQWHHSRGAIKTAEGWERLPIDLGDQTSFPLHYSDGQAPTSPDEIAVSYRVADSQALKAGDVITFKDAMGERELTVSGVYQDITNGGVTGKGVWTPDPDEVERWVFNVKLKAEDTVAETTERLRNTYDAVSVVSVADSGADMMGPVISTIEKVVLATLIVAGIAAFGLTALFLRMVLASDRTEYAAMRGIGFTDGWLRRSLTIRYSTLLAIGFVIGVVLAWLMGRFLIGPLAGSMMGAPQLQLMGVPWLALVALPLILFLGVWLGVRVASAQLKNLSVQNVTEE